VKTSVNTSDPTLSIKQDSDQTWLPPIPTI